MRKYFFVYSLYLQEGMAQRASFLMERFRAVVVLISFYYFWTAILGQQESVAGYDRMSMLTYVLGMNVMRGMVFSGRTWEIASEINQGRLSGYLVKPVSFSLYAFFRDLSDKSINFASSIVEILGLALIFGMTIRWPEHAMTWVYFILSAASAIVLYFMLSFMTACAGFWTAESGGPRWLFELFLEFSAGAFFPIDVLPEKVQAVFRLLPSPFMVFYPLQIFLEKLEPHQIINVFVSQSVWLIIAGTLCWSVWQKGIQNYGAEGA